MQSCFEIGLFRKIIVFCLVAVMTFSLCVNLFRDYDLFEGQADLIRSACFVLIVFLYAY